MKGATDANATPCDNQSVGVVVWENGRMLFIERAKPPVGLAPPAGHVDADGSFEEAASREVEEEVGIHVRVLELMAEGRKENPCRRGGSWHYWKIYVARDIAGVPKRKPDEVKSIRWLALDEIRDALGRTERYLSGQISDNEWFECPGIEPVWSEWLCEICPEVFIDHENDEKGLTVAREYAWNWFGYHAEQRQLVFRFYLIVAALAGTAYAAANYTGSFGMAGIVGLTLAVGSFLFWRLDVRSQHLVKLAEKYLKQEERRLARHVGPSIRFAAASDDRRSVKPFLKNLRLYSFKQLYGWLFFLIGAVGVFGGAWGLMRWISGSS